MSPKDHGSQTTNHSPVRKIADPRTKRRRFLRRCLVGTSGLAIAGVVYPFLEAGWIRIRRVTIAVPHLPRPFRGARIALLADIHHGPYTSLDYVERVVKLTNALSPDLVLLAGDYVHRHTRYIRPCLQAHADLYARWGVFGVLGNHDHWEGADITRAAMKSHGIVELTNTGTWLFAKDARLRLAGVGDLWMDSQDLDKALGDTQPSETSILLSHNPDFVESITDRRVGLVLSGHTHGGQVVLPGYGAPYVPSRYGQKYLHGLVKTPHTQVYVTRGVGTIYPPVRFCCRPEIVVLTLA